MCYGPDHRNWLCLWAREQNLFMSCGGDPTFGYALGANAPNLVMCYGPDHRNKLCAVPPERTNLIVGYEPGKIFFLLCSRTQICLMRQGPEHKFGYVLTSRAQNLVMRSGPESRGFRFRTIDYNTDYNTETEEPCLKDCNFLQRSVR